MHSVDLVDAFERCALPNDGFHHRDHIHVIWNYLRQMSLLQALERFSMALRRFATIMATRRCITRQSPGRMPH